jgi:hypothetical protein
VRFVPSDSGNFSRFHRVIIETFRVFVHKTDQVIPRAEMVGEYTGDPQTFADHGKHHQILTYRRTIKHDDGTEETYPHFSLFTSLRLGSLIMTGYYRPVFRTGTFR